MKLRTLIPAAAATLLAATPATAQSADTTAAATDNSHRNSIAVTIGESPTIGLWHRFSPNVEAGLELFGQRQENSYDDGSQESHTTAIGVAPAIKVYTRPAGELRPYVFGSAGITFVHAENTYDIVNAPRSEQDVRTFDGALALGLEWAPAERIRIGGHAGVRGSWGKSDAENTDGREVEGDGSSIGSFTSGLRVQFYF